MGSATTHALTVARRALADAGDAANLAIAQELFAASRVLDRSAQLRAALSDPSKDSAAKAQLVAHVFGARLGEVSLSLLVAVVSQRWSNQSDLLAGIEEIGVRAIAANSPAEVPLDAELFAIGNIVSGDAQLELALRSKLASPESKAELIERLLTDKVSHQTLALVRQLVLQPRGRSIRESLRRTASIVADQAGFAVATVVSAGPLSDGQLERLRTRLSRQYSRSLRFNQVIDPSLIGGLRVSIGDDVIDSSVATRINDVKLQLVG